MSDVTQSNALPPSSPGTLGEIGAELWTRMVGAYRLGPGHLALLHEACRLADRLDKMDALIRGDTDEWVTVMAGQGFDAPELKLEMGSAVIEARLTATALKGIMTELRQAGAVGAAETAAPTILTEQEGGGDVIDILARRARARRTPGT